MGALTAAVDPAAGDGRWRIWAKPAGHEPIEVTWVRGVPTQLGDYSTADPFGPQTASLTFPSVTMYDRLGDGELAWLAPEVDFEIAWDGPLPAGYPYSRFVWEGYSVPFEHSQDEIAITLVGAMMQMDNYKAKPEYAANPFPYEVAISRCWRDKPDLRLKPLEVRFPSWWTLAYTPTPGQLGAFTPTGVAPGALWTGMLTRETGSWDNLLTSYIQTLLASMYTRKGRFTLDLEPDRRPVLVHRDFLIEPNAATVVIESTQPGVKVNLTGDVSQSANVFYGQTKALTGEAYSGMQVIGDGTRTVYKPLAALRQVDPVNDRNTWLDPSRMRREQVLQVQEGMRISDLLKVGAAALAANADPGYTGTIELDTDPRMNGGQIISRQLIRAGMSVLLPGFRGDPNGILLHVTGTSWTAESETMTLTVDSKYRDKLTVEEVRARGRDALAVPRMLITGKVAPLLPDSLLPWNYAEGSGYIPSSPTYSARRLLEDMPSDIAFPWTEWTTQRPPRSASWRSCYIGIGPANLTKADDNWAAVGNRGGVAGGVFSRFGFPIRMAQAGAVRSLQLAAYDADGNVMPVGFHFSIYYQRTVSVGAMPKIPAGRIPAGSSFHTGDHYPFFEGAWESHNELGVETGLEVPVSVKTAGLIQGWGTSNVRAGYWPGSSSAGDPATGLLVDEGSWNWDTVGQSTSINPFAYNDVDAYAGYLYCMVYCDRQLNQPVYFLGRMFRVEPGQQS
jgi:hypothetical protein